MAAVSVGSSAMQLSDLLDHYFADEETHADMFCQCIQCHVNRHFTKSTQICHLPDALVCFLEETISRITTYVYK